MGYNTHTRIRVKNNFAQTLKKITLTKQYSDDKVYSQTWENVSPGEMTSPWRVGYNTGFLRTGMDYWNITVVTDTNNVFVNATRDKQCFLTKKDANTNLVFGVSPSSFDINLDDGCKDGMSFNGYNTNTLISVKNNFAQTLKRITLTKQYSDDKVYSQTWENVTPGEMTSPWRVGYNTGVGRTGQDYWNITVVTETNDVFVNATPDKRCFLTADDAYTTLTFGVSPSSFDLNLNSSSCWDPMGFKFEGGQYRESTIFRNPRTVKNQQEQWVNLAPDRRLEVVRQFVPVFYFHKYERYFPCSIEHLLPYTSLQAFTSVQGTETKKEYSWSKRKPSPKDLMAEVEQIITATDIDGSKFNLEIVDGAFAGMRDKKGNVTAPIYYAIQAAESWVDIHYMIMYANQGGQSAQVFDPPGNMQRHLDCVLNTFGQHQYDLEQIVVRVSGDSHDNYHILLVGYEADGYLTWHQPGEYTHENDHPKVYVALLTHGNHQVHDSVISNHYQIVDQYARLGTKGLIEGLIEDAIGDPAALAITHVVGNSGPTWRPTHFRLLGVDQDGEAIGPEKWVKYRGSFGKAVTHELDGPTYLDGTTMDSDAWDLINNITLKGIAWIGEKLDKIKEEYRKGHTIPAPGSRDYVRHRQAAAFHVRSTLKPEFNGVYTRLTPGSPNGDKVNNYKGHRVYISKTNHYLFFEPNPDKPKQEPTGVWVLQPGPLRKPWKPSGNAITSSELKSTQELIDSRWPDGISISPHVWGNVSTTDGMVVYDGKPHSLEVMAEGFSGEEIPVKLSYEGTGATIYGPTDEPPTEAGTYDVAVSIGVKPVEGDKNWYQAQSSNAVSGTDHVEQSYQKTVPFRIWQATPRVTWPTPEQIVFGTALGDKELNATATAEVGGEHVELNGKFTYLWNDKPISPGEALPAGKHTLHVNFEPDDAGNFKSATASVPIQVWLATHVFSKYEAGNEETFSHLALKHYGHATPYYWQWIIDANKGNIPENYRHVQPGTKVFIPEPPPPPGSDGGDQPSPLGDPM